MKIVIISMSQSLSHSLRMDMLTMENDFLMETDMLELFLCLISMIYEK